MKGSTERLVDCLVKIADEEVEAIEARWLGRIVLEVYGLRQTNSDGIEERINNLDKRYGKDFSRVISIVEAFVASKGTKARML